MENSTKEATGEQQQKRYIILDTNIISSFGNPSLGEKLLTVLKEAADLGYGTAISDITILEVINGTSAETESKMMGILEGIDRFSIETDILFAAAHLGGQYKAHELQLDQFGVCDQIIAATSIMRNAIVYTKNPRDFPAPMFKELDRRMLEYTSKEYPVCVPTYFMEPQLDYITAHYESRLDEFKRNEERKSKKSADPRHRKPV